MTPSGDADLVRIIYRSRSRIGGTASDIEEELRTLLDGAQARNAAAGVTGALLFTQLMFIQVLEGSAAAVEAVFERISRDLRHTTVEVMEYGAIEERGFGVWSMRQLVPGSDMVMAIDPAVEDATEASRLALTLMRALLRAGDAAASPADVAA